MQAMLPKIATRRYRIVRKVRESEIITSFYLAPADGEALAAFKPGQFLTFQLQDPERGGVVRRNYSLSGSPDWPEHYRISVKREAASGESYPAGMVSNHLHDAVDVGDELQARGPDGRFVLDVSHGRPVVLLSGGVGLTPLVAMAHALAKDGRRKAHFIHACENGNVHALGQEIKELARSAANLRLHVCYRNPDARDQIGRDYDSAGVITPALLQTLLPLDDYDFYLCGPGPFMQSVFAQLIELGVREERIRYEFFGPATLLHAAPASDKGKSKPLLAAAAASASSAPPAPATDTPMVTFSNSRMTVAWDPTFDTLLDFAEAQGLAPAFSCRAGICSTCLCDLPAGEVDYVAEPLDEPAQGKALLCCSRPRGDVVIAL